MRFILEPRLYKPKSKMQQLAEEFRKSKDISDDYKSAKVNIKQKVIFNTILQASILCEEKGTNMTNNVNQL